MKSNYPILIKRSTIPGNFAEIPVGMTADKHAYIARDILVEQVASKQQGQLHDPTYLLRSHYWIQKGGNNFAENLKRILSRSNALNVENLIQFKDENGIVWWIFELGIHCVSQYDGELEVQIIQHFVGTAIHIDGHPVDTYPPMAASDPMSKLSIAVALNKQVANALAIIVEHDEHLSRHDTQLADHSYLLADLRARAGTAPGKMIMREFISTRLHVSMSDTQIHQYGIELSKHLRTIRSRWTPGKIWDSHARREVNEYEITDLEKFFRGKGLHC